MYHENVSENVFNYNSKNEVQITDHIFAVGFSSVKIWTVPQSPENHYKMYYNTNTKRHFN